ncbi:hypothetical protein LINPERPRIM_LOCUS38505, partial [Linum perenne]
IPPKIYASYNEADCATQIVGRSAINMNPKSVEIHHTFTQRLENLE